MASSFSDQTELLELSTRVKSDSIPFEAETELLASAADEFHALAQSLDGAGCSAAALHLHSAVSLLDRALPQRQGWWSAPFNGQVGRSQLFLRILDAIQPTAVIETGTFRGTTTAFIAKNFDGPIFSCEVDPRWYLASRVELARFPNVQIRRQDSRHFLKEVLAEAKGDVMLYYLDAHWQEDLPLSGELELILSDDRAAVVIIDDFAVPFDAAYQFDDYGPGMALTIELLAQLDPKGATLFFPTLPASEETGARRGCAVIGVGRVASQLTSLAELRRDDWPAGKHASIPVKPKISSLPNLEPLRRLVMSRNVELDRAAARSEAEMLRRECDAARAETLSLRRECDVARAEAAALRASTSWRITAPLRGVGRLFRR